MRCQLIIKAPGGGIDALDHCQRHKIPVQDIKGITDYNEVIVETKELGKAEYMRIATWFCEPPLHPEPGKGFPIGTLLHYSSLHDAPTYPFGALLET